MTSNEIGVFVPPEALFPGIEATEATMQELLRPLGRDAVLIACARLNTVVSGTGVPDIKARQERAIGMICSGEDLRRINEFARGRPSGDLPIVFFRGGTSRVQFRRRRSRSPTQWRQWIESAGAGSGSFCREREAAVGRRDPGSQPDVDKWRGISAPRGAAGLGGRPTLLTKFLHHKVLVISGAAQRRPQRRRQRVAS
jgi:hypothetical protein